MLIINQVSKTSKVNKDRSNSYDTINMYMKYVITIVITAVIVFLAATIFYKGIPNINYGQPSVAATPTPVGTESTPSASPVVSEATPAGPTTIKAGGVLVFKPYVLSIPAGWSSKKENAPNGEIELDKLTLTKDNYKITIYQAATGGAMCLYPGDAKVEGPSSSYDSYVDLTTSSGEKLRKSTSGVNKSATVCEFQQGGWGQPTSFGHISIEVPANGGTAAMTQEIDKILMSIKKV